MFQRRITIFRKKITDTFTKRKILHQEIQDKRISSTLLHKFIKNTKKFQVHY